MNEKLWLEMAQEIRTQDNASTAEPIYIVQQRQRMYGIDPDLCDDGEIVWMDLMNDHEEIKGEEAKSLEEAYQESLEIPENYTRTGYMDTWEFVQPFFTKKGAEDYIEVNRHRLTDPRIYVDSAYRNYEWQEVRKRLLTTELKKLRDNVFSVFEGVTLDNPLYFWFLEENPKGAKEYVVRKVVGEYGGTLWTDDKGYGLRVTDDVASRCLGRVATFDQVEALRREIEELKQK